MYLSIPYYSAFKTYGLFFSKKLYIFIKKHGLFLIKKNITWDFPSGLMVRT